MLEARARAESSRARGQKGTADEKQGGVRTGWRKLSPVSASGYHAAGDLQERLVFGAMELNTHWPRSWRCWGRRGNGQRSFGLSRMPQGLNLVTQDLQKEAKQVLVH